MFFILSKLLDVFLSPYTWGLLLFAAAVPWRMRMRSARSTRRRRSLGAMGLAVLVIGALSPVSNTMMWRLEHASTPTYDSEVTYDAVILLGGLVDEKAMKTSGQISFNDNVERLIVTYRLLRDGKARVVIASGENPEAAVLGQQLEDWGIAPDRIIIEGVARNTHENAVFSQVIARARRFERVLVVTSAFHMLRAAECFAAVGMKVDTLSVDYRAHQKWPVAEWIIPRVGELTLSTTVVREVTGRLIYRMQGYAKPVP